MAFSKYFVNGQTGLGEHWTQWFGDFFSNFVGNGFVITEDTGLNISISAGRAYIKDSDGLMFQVVSDASESLTMADDSTNYVYLHCDNGSSWLTTDTVGTNEDDSIILGVVTTVDSAITDITNSARVTPLIKSDHIYLSTNLWASTIYTEPASGAPISGDYEQTSPKFFEDTFNVFQDKFITLEKIKFTLTAKNEKGNITDTYLNSLKTYYCVEDGTEVLIGTETASGTYEYELSLPVTIDPNFKPYIKFVSNCDKYSKLIGGENPYFHYSGQVVITNCYISFYRQ